MAANIAGALEDLAKEIVRRGELAPERLLDLGGLIQVKREIARERRGRLAKLWARFDRPAVRKRLRALRAEAPRAPKAGESSEPASVMPTGRGAAAGGDR